MAAALDHDAPSATKIAEFVDRWSKAGASERSNCAPFIIEMCELLGLPRPDPASAETEHNAYVFERAVPLHYPDGKKTMGRIDLYKRACFVLEAKQYTSRAAEPAELALESGASKGKAGIQRGSEAWDRALLAARGQAERYARSLPAEEEPPPFLVVVDVGHVIELYADFTQKGKAYLPFPEARSHRIRLADLAKEEVRERLRLVWTQPLALDPSRKSAEVTREVAGFLAELAKTFEKKHEAKTVAAFLSRCLFCMFAEDVNLLPKGSFTALLESLRSNPGGFVPVIQALFKEMDTGTKFSIPLRQKLLHFNGGLFADTTALPVNGTQLGLLINAAKKDWKHVEPAIFGTLLERALNSEERHKLGAHYTPRSYVERLVLPTVIEPLREEWQTVRAAAVTLATRGDLKGAIKEVRSFHHRLCQVRVLDPACGSGNFLYVTLEHMKRLEGEVFELLSSFGDSLPLDLNSETVDPHQFLGLEINPRAASIAELVLWIGYLQWHFRTRGEAVPAEPVLKKFANIEYRDAVLAYDKEELAKDETGKVKFVWDRRTKKVDAVTGREVPDEKAVMPLKTYLNPRPAKWPQADYIVGNPPFIGTARMREDLGDGYTETLRLAYPEVPESADFVMYWWYKAAEATLAGKTRRFGLITTNSIKQTFNRRVVHQALMKDLSIRFAIPDHPWVDTTDGAAVRIAMTVGAMSYKLPPKGVLEEPPPPDPSALVGDLFIVKKEIPFDDGSNDVSFVKFRGRIASDLTIGAELAGMVALKANEGLAYRGMQLIGSGFIIAPQEAKALGLGKVKGLEKYIRPYRHGRDLTDTPRDVLVIDLFGLTQKEVQARFPKVYEHVLQTVKPERDLNNRASYRLNWWIHGEPRRELRPLLTGVRRYIATVETSKHRFFQFLSAEILPDNRLVIIGLEDAFYLAVLSSQIHVAFSLAAGGTLEDRPVYTKSRCFDPFPFPDCTEKQKAKIRELAEALDAHRKRAQVKHGLGLTDIYNVLEKVRAGITLNAHERQIHDAALIATLRQLHDELDAAVADAYGWPWPLSDAEILERVVALNAKRAEEEAKGLVRWLRPDFQIPRLAPAQQTEIELAHDAESAPYRRTAKDKAKKQRWPKSLAERIAAVQAALVKAGSPVMARELAKSFARADAADIEEILETLVALGKARPGDKTGTFVA